MGTRRFNSSNQFCTTSIFVSAVWFTGLKASAPTESDGGKDLRRKYGAWGTHGLC